jgi:hypothetical protein
LASAAASDQLPPLPSSRGTSRVSMNTAQSGRR